MSEILDQIVNCTISIETPVMDSASYSTMLLIGRPPAIQGGEIGDIEVYRSLRDVLDKGWSESSNVYKAAKTAFLQNAKSIYIAPIKGEETIQTTVERALETAGWYGLVTVDIDKDDYETVADIIEPEEKLYCFSTNELKSPLVKREYMRTFGIYSDKDEFISAAWMAHCFGFSAGSETWAFKSLAGIEVSEYKSSDMRKLENDNLSYYVPCGGKNITQGGKTLGGEWIDVIRFRDWLKNQMQISVYALFAAYPKLPYTDDGAILIENMMESVLKNGQQRGGIDETRFDDDVPDYGYTVSVPKASSLNASQRASRVLPDCNFTARLAGAIHATEIRGNLVY